MYSLKHIQFIFFTNVCMLTTAQNYNLGFSYPIDRSPVITGNYGEIRPNHFHAGLDFSTDAVINLPIKSVADGYVSRIKISSGGYGKVLYVTHANGYVSVYAHQKKYADTIDLYTKQKQREQKKNEIELFLTPNVLPLKKGEVIGYTGNTGSSTGPHLHFEIREEKSETPINPLLVYDIKDEVKPIINSVSFYNTSDTENIKLIILENVKAIANKLSIPKNIITLPENAFAIGFSGYDVSNGSTNKNNIYDAKIKLDNQLIYHHQLNNISFDNGRYVNIFSEKLNGQKIQKCFTPTCYDIAIYKTLVNSGKIMLPDTLQHNIALIVTDEKGNTNTLTFLVKAKNISGYVTNKKLHNVFCNTHYNLKKEDFELTIPAGSIAKASLVGVYYNKLGKLVVGNKSDVLLKPFTINLKIYNAIKTKEDKIVFTNGDNCFVGKYSNGWYAFDSKTFGSYSLSYDTIAPNININLSKKKISTLSQLSFKISDNLSGIADYAVFVNDVWQIAEYDAKNETVTCIFTEAPKGPNSVRIEVIDKVGNKGIINY